MKQSITFGGLTVEAGTKQDGFAPVLDTGYSFPLTVVNGAYEGKTLLLTAGIHGGEYPCIQAAIELSKEIDPTEIHGQIVIIHPVNVSAFLARVSYILPEDGKNLNRLFPGDKNGTFGDKLAYVITTEYQDKSDFYVDMHGGDLHEQLPPYVYHPGIGDNTAALDYAYEAAKVVNVNYRVKSSATTGAYNSAAIRGIPSLLLERGGRGLWDKDEVEAYKEDIYNVIKFLEIMNVPVPAKRVETVEITNAVYLDSTATGCWYPLVGMEERVKKGQKIGEVRDFFGKVLAEYYAEFDCIVLFLTVSLAITEGDPIITYGI